MSTTKQPTKAETITAWVLASASASLTVVIAWWIWQSPEVFLERLGVTSDGWRMPLVWVAALLIALAYIAYTAWAVPMVRRRLFTFSWLKIIGIWAAVVSGIVEEVVFRHLLMDGLMNAGVGVGVQIAVSALAFGVAHAAWVGLSGTWKTAGYTVVSTAALGALLAGLYIMADRSTLPSVVAHIVVNLGIEPWLILGVVAGGKHTQRGTGHTSRDVSSEVV